VLGQTDRAVEVERYGVFEPTGRANAHAETDSVDAGRVKTTLQTGRWSPGLLRSEPGSRRVAISQPSG
jgi:hypothetical protein